ncbi:hypothetical protein, partial [Kribbella sp.]|uniref:hypothetical protein n=1 Tax=Kribbella sp. TaxID=1871183 RepID=UPI002D3D6C08
MRGVAGTAASSAVGVAGALAADASVEASAFGEVVVPLVVVPADAGLPVASVVVPEAGVADVGASGSVVAGGCSAVSVGSAEAWPAAVPLGAVAPSAGEASVGSTGVFGVDPAALAATSASVAAVASASVVSVGWAVSAEEACGWLAGSAALAEGAVGDASPSSVLVVVAEADACESVPVAELTAPALSWGVAASVAAWPRVAEVSLDTEVFPGAEVSLDAETSPGTEVPPEAEVSPGTEVPLGAEMSPEADVPLGAEEPRDAEVSPEAGVSLGEGVSVGVGGSLGGVVLG